MGACASQAFARSHRPHLVSLPLPALCPPRHGCSHLLSQALTPAVSGSAAAVRSSAQRTSLSGSGCDSYCQVSAQPILTSPFFVSYAPHALAFLGKSCQSLTSLLTFLERVTSPLGSSAGGHSVQGLQIFLERVTSPLRSSAGGCNVWGWWFSLLRVEWWGQSGGQSSYVTWSPWSWCTPRDGSLPGGLGHRPHSEVFLATLSATSAHDSTAGLLTQAAVGKAGALLGEPS